MGQSSNSHNTGLKLCSDLQFGLCESYFNFLQDGKQIIYLYWTVAALGALLLFRGDFLGGKITFSMAVSLAPQKTVFARDYLSKLLVC